MKNVFIILSVALMASTFSVGANAAQPGGPSFKGHTHTQKIPLLHWRCGKNNPAEWGTFGNGCLKQKRNWGKSTSSSKAFRQ